ncbi:MAG: ATP-grasp domain-containing protein [Candidatus Omnitrophota bacterium]
MKIGITYDLKTDWVKKDSDPADINAEFDKPETLEMIIAAIESGGHEVIRIGNFHQLIQCVEDLNVDFVYNMCEGRSGRNRESQVPIILEMNQIPYLGADALSLGVTLDKIMAKKVFMGQNIPTPGYFSAESTDDLEQLNTIGFPLMVKTKHEGSSKGINNESRVQNITELKRRVDFINRTYSQPALVEQFIAGREFTVPVLGNATPVAMPVVQICIDGNLELDDRIYTNERIYSAALKYVCPAQITPELTKEIQEIAVKVFRSVDCRDLARIDFRVSKEGRPYVLEINPLPTMDKEDVFHVFPQLFGLDFNQILNIILNISLARYGLIDQTEQELLKPFYQEINA